MFCVLYGTLIYMKVLGIDYGRKRIGLAISDELGSIAFPHGIIKVVIENDAIKEIAKLVLDKKIGEVVLGLPQGDGSVADKVQEFSKKLRTATSLIPRFVDESFTSYEAFKQTHDAHQEKGRYIKVDMSPKDDVAATLILQRYLDRKKGMNT